MLMYVNLADYSPPYTAEMTNGQISFFFGSIQFTDTSKIRHRNLC